ICDVAEDLLERMAAIHSPRVVYSKYEDMLGDPNVEAVIVATSDAFHVPLSLQAIAAGKHVFVEKPLGLAVEECEELKRKVDASSLKLQIGLNRRFDPAVAFAKQFIDEEMGRLSLFHSWYCDSVARYTMTDNLQAIPVQSAQKRTPPRDPKADKRNYFLLTHGSHLFDTAYFLAGPITALEARWREDAGAHHWSISLEFASGCLGTLAMAIPARADFQSGINIFGEGGSVQGKLHLPWYRKAGDLECFSAKDGVYRRALGADGDSYKLQLESFASSILDGAPQRGANVADGVDNMRALAAVARSVESGGWKKLSEMRGTV
ncbi:MAG TPA: Gfo/Idh/MocA family oxidoreductase, partial [Bryobacteraceae bacterium]